MNLDAFSDKRLRSQLLAAAEFKQIESEARFAGATHKPMEGGEAAWQIFNCLQRRKGLILKMMLLGGILAVVASLFFPPSYFATAQLILDLGRADPANAGALSAIGPFTAAAEESAIDTHITSLISDAHLRQTLEYLRAADEKHRTSGEAATEPEKAALTRLRRGLEVKQERRSKIISVSYKDPNPEKAAHITNAVAELYVDSLRREKREEAEVAVTRLTQRLPQVQEDVARAENEVHLYRQTHITNEVVGPDETEQQITQTARQLALARSSVMASRERLEQFRNLRSHGGSTAEIAKALDSPRLAELAQIEARQVDTGPDAADASSQDLKRAIDDEVTASVARLEAEERTYQSQNQSVEQRLALLRQAANEGADGTIGLRALERKSAALAQFYDSLLRQRQELAERSKLAEPEVRILAAAQPPNYPASLNRLFLIPPAIIAFTLLGCMISLILDRLDHTLHGERETAEALQIQCAGLVPEIAHRQMKSIPSLLRDSPRTPYSKAIRSVFAATMPLCAASREQKIILVTSSVPGEGKTALAWSLAFSAAQLRWRVLLLEVGGQVSSLRSDMLNTDEFAAPAANLSDVMAQRSSLASATGLIGDTGINYLPLSCNDKDLLSLLANPQFPDLLEQLRNAYDLVIMDGPSVLDGMEVRLLTGKADKILFAVRWGSTPRETVRTALNLIETCDPHDATCTDKSISILTRVNLRQHARYRFADQGDLLFGRQT
jgi:uncharacterized protein involved in exopolysaccharide biosynthesis/Mrp family chromosome partitioning ATPase